jgi:hypothetical protein
MTPISSEWEIEFYTNARGDCPPLDFINGLPKKERAKIYSYIDYLKDVGVLARMPQARHLSGALWELRPSSHRSQVHHFACLS